MGSFLIMGLFGLIIASLVNIFLKSSGLAFRRNRWPHPLGIGGRIPSESAASIGRCQ